MNIKKILLNGLLIAIVIAAVAFIPDAGARIVSWFVPPRLFILIGVVIIIVLWKILIELRNRNNRDDEE